jgi:hypothetical protein
VTARPFLAAAFVAAAALTAPAHAAPPAPPAPLHSYGGTLEIRHTDDFKHGRAATHYELVRRGGPIPLALARPPRILSGSRVILNGRRAGSRLKGLLRPAYRRAAAKAAAVTARPRKVAVILVRFGTSPPDDDPTSDFVRQRVFTDPDSTNAYYQEDSYGDISLIGKTRADGDVFGWYTVAPPVSDPSWGCDVDQIATNAEAAAAADGFVASGYDHIVYAFPYQDMCGWAGLGEMPGTHAWINGYIDQVDVVAHELGHNMGLNHASGLSCTNAGTPVAIGPSCTIQEYGDPFDVMGSTSHRNNAWHLDQIGFMAPARVQVANGDGTYTLDSTHTRTTGTQLLRVRRPAGASPAYYDLELRSSGGVFDSFLSTDPAVMGVTIHTDPETTTLARSMLIDTTPGSPGGFRDAPLTVGHTFSDGTVSITVQSISGGVATVDVGTGAPPVDVTPPSVPGPVSAVASPGSVAVSWPAASDDVGVAGYRLYRGSTLITTTTGLSFTDNVVSPGASYSYRVAAFDAAGHVSTSAPVTVTIPAATPPPPPPTTSGDPGSSTPPVTGSGAPGTRDLTRPRVRITSPSRRARVRRRAVVQAVGTDNVRVVRMEVWVDLRRRAVESGSKVSWSWVLRHARAGRHVVAVRAFDAAGNESTATVRPFVVR